MKHRPPPDDLDPPRGTFVGVAIGVVFWLIALLVYYWWVL